MDYTARPPALVLVIIVFCELFIIQKSVSDILNFIRNSNIIHTFYMLPDFWLIVKKPVNFQKCQKTLDSCRL